MKIFATLNDQSILLFKQAIQRLNLSARAFHRVIKIARTIADLENSGKIKSNHVVEALQYRPHFVPNQKGCLGIVHCKLDDHFTNRNFRQYTATFGNIW